jgi:Ca2+-binding EF-hand superfamily protein
MLIAAAVSLLALAPASAQEEETTSDLMVIFLEADRDNNKVLDKGEVLIVAIEQFDEVDVDNDGKIEKEEVDDLALVEEFSDNDTNKDGAIEIEEMINEKVDDFNAADKDNSGTLSYEEVDEAYESLKTP